MSDLHHLAAAYALDALDESERRAFEAHYPSCEICAQEVTDFRAVANSLADTTATAPPSDLKSKVMAEISGTRQLSPIAPAQPLGRAESAGRWLLAAAAALLVVAGLAITTLRDTTSDADPVIEVVEALDAVTTPLDPTVEGPSGRIQVHWSADQDRVAVVGHQLDDITTEQAYALWFVFGDGSVAPAGLFQPEDGFYSDVLEVDDRMPTGWGISIEPTAGSPQPTTPVLFFGTV